MVRKNCIYIYFENKEDMNYWWISYGGLRKREEPKTSPRILTWVTQKSKLPFTKMGRLKKDQVWGTEIQEFGSEDVVFGIWMPQSLKRRLTLVSWAVTACESLPQGEGMDCWLCVLLWPDHILIIYCILSFICIIYILSHIHVSYTDTYTGRADKNTVLRKSEAG